MREVLTRMMQDMYEEKMPFCFLMPADERIYLPFDFTYIFDQPHWKLKEGTPLERVSLEDAAKLRQSWPRLWETGCLTAMRCTVRGMKHM